MTRILSLLAALLLLVTAASAPAAATPGEAPGKVAAKPLFRDPVFDGAADPVIVNTGADGRWLMLYTNRRANMQGASGVAWVHGTPIGIAESLDGGASWRYVGMADIELPPDLGGANATRWAPDVVRDDAGLFHMFLTVVPGVFEDWKHPRHMVHLTSGNLRTWRNAKVIALPTERAIDASLIRLPSGGWRMYYNNELDKKSIWYVDSGDLEHWSAAVKAIGDQAGEGPKVFQWRGSWWMITDVWRGLAVYRSADGQHWERQAGNLLALPGKGMDDQVMGNHADVVVSGERAYLFYFTHPGRTAANGKLDNYETRRSSIQVTELLPDGAWLKVERDLPTHIALRP